MLAQLLDDVLYLHESWIDLDFELALFSLGNLYLLFEKAVLTLQADRRGIRLAVVLRIQIAFNLTVLSCFERVTVDELASQAHAALLNYFV